MTLVELKQVSKKFGKTVAVDQCTLELEAGKIYGLLGPNGSGKSTLMKMVAGLFKQTQGSIFVNKAELSYKSKADVAYMTTEPFMYPHMTIGKIGKFFEEFFEDFDKMQYQLLIKEMGLEMNMKVSKLSSGMDAKLKIAATLARKAKIIMLDEPLNGIDLVAREAIIKAIIKAATDENTLLISSHLVEQMEPILDEVIFIKQGEIVMNGHIEQIREEQQQSIVSLYKEVFAC